MGRKLIGFSDDGDEKNRLSTKNNSPVDKFTPIHGRDCGRRATDGR